LKYLKVEMGKELEAPGGRAGGGSSAG